jgi:hypothetical protein
VLGRLRWACLLHGGFESNLIVAGPLSASIPRRGVDFAYRTDRQSVRDWIRQIVGEDEWDVIVVIRSDRPAVTRSRRRSSWAGWRSLRCETAFSGVRPSGPNGTGGWVGTMLSPNERQVLQEIERGLQVSDPDLARSLQSLTPVGRWACQRWMLLVGAALAMLLGIAGVVFSNLPVGLAGVTASAAASSAYVIAVIGDRLRKP